MPTPTLLAGIDLGSNSFRLEIGQVEAGHIQRVEYLKETVRQGNGLDADRNLSEDAMQRGWDCLARFAERIAGFKKSQVRAVATQTLREARNRDAFISKGSAILGFPIDVISGREEARLIYCGVANLLPQSDERRLVVDIGGRSTEFILGQALASSVTESYRLGSVAWSMKYFADGKFSPSSFERAEIAACAILDEAQAAFSKDHWDCAYGSSGTVGAVADVLQAAGYTPAMVTAQGLDWLRAELLRCGSADKITLAGIKEDRRAVIGGGVAVLRAVFRLLDISQMQVAQGALRQGIVYDLIDRAAEVTDVRASTVLHLRDKFSADAAQAQRVSKVAMQFFKQLSESVEFESQERLARKLNWAAQLHEIGSRISHSDYHKHGAYILDNADAPGFALPELHRLSQLVLGHRGKLRKLDATLDDNGFSSQLLALRLAVILCHARRTPDTAGLELRAVKNSFVMCTPLAWSVQYPQSAHLLQEEVLAWQKSRFQFQVEVV
jgi:exopolyphosphatase / guanosine-5'-triphosphate,3'-diphosphate pyrophosphatase